MALPPASEDKLSACDQRLQDLCHRVAEFWPFIVAVGYRNEADQDAAIAAGKSKDPWPTSKHNRQPSLAVDLVPSPINWTDILRFAYFAGFVKGIAATMGIPIRWGGDFGRTLDPATPGFKDYDHFEIDDPLPPEGTQTT